jgi:hypothetical protein
MRNRIIQYYITSILSFLFYLSVNCQPTKKAIALKDSVDGKFDLSDYIIDANGFVPIPYIITEPALGGFGGALFPVFIKKKPAYRDSVKGRLQVTPIAPDITGGGAIYTANKTWGTFGFRSGTIVKRRIKYVVGGGYIHLNMSFYKTFEQIGEKELQFTIDAIPAVLQVTKRIGVSRWYAGFKYVFLKTSVSFRGDSSLNHLVDTLLTDKLVSQLGVIVEMDNRDNVFTPDKGLKLHADFNRSEDAIGSDYDFWRLNYYAYWYRPLSKNIFAGLRIDGRQTFGEPPFYMLPFIELRGIPSARYQGKVVLLSELETRFDITKRWSIMAFGGTGKAFDEWDKFGEASFQFSYGTGGRYLLARKFKLRVGIDVAHSPNTWAYYIVFGSNWVK